MYNLYPMNEFIDHREQTFIYFKSTPLLKFYLSLSQLDHVCPIAKEDAHYVRWGRPLVACFPLAHCWGRAEVASALAASHTTHTYTVYDDGLSLNSLCASSDSQQSFSLYSIPGRSWRVCRAAFISLAWSLSLHCANSCGAASLTLALVFTVFNLTRFFILVGASKNAPKRKKKSKYRSTRATNNRTTIEAARGRSPIKINWFLFFIPYIFKLKFH